jgi:hypothetical protein
MNVASRHGLPYGKEHKFHKEGKFYYAKLATQWYQ